MLDVWSVLSESKEKLKQNWEANEDEWKKIEEKREESEKKPNMRRFPLVVVVGMLLCWIAQWLWWAGYIGVAGDRYCPPKLPALASIWTLFSATGKSRCPEGNRLVLTSLRVNIWGKFLSSLRVSLKVIAFRSGWKGFSLQAASFTNIRRIRHSISVIGNSCFGKLQLGRFCSQV